MDKSAKKLLQKQYNERRVKGGVYAIENLDNRKLLLLCTTDMPGSLNRFEFAVQAGGCVHPKLMAEWSKGRFAIKVVEELEKKQDQTDREFEQEIQALYEITRESYPPSQLY